MNPTSPARTSPVYVSSDSSPASQREETEPAPSSGPTQWIVGIGYSFPVYSRHENEQFSQKFDQFVKTISLKIQTMISCLSEFSSSPITTSWEAFSTLVSCLENDLSNQIPLSLFTSDVASASIANIEHAPPAKKSKASDSSEASDLQKKTLAEAKELERILSSMFDFLRTGVQLNTLKEKNPEKHQAHRALQHTIAKRLSVFHSVLNNDERDLAERIIAVISPQRDIYSEKAKMQLLIGSTTELVRRQNALIRDICISSAYQENHLPWTGKDLFAICHQHTASIIAPPINLEELSSWPEFIFCYLAQTFLQKKTERIPTQTDSQSLLAELRHHVPWLTTRPSYEMKQFAINFLKKDFLKFYWKQSINKLPRNINPSARYNELLQCSLSVTKILQGLFIIDTNSCFSEQNFSAFQEYTQTLHFPNTTAAINHAIQEIASICLRGHQKMFSNTRLLLEEAHTLLKQLAFQSLALVLAQSNKYKNVSHNKLIFCKNLPDELRRSDILYNYFQEAIRTHHAGLLFSENIPKSATPLKLMLTITGSKLQKTFQELCYTLFTNIFSEMPLKGSQSTLEQFSAAVCALKINLSLKHTSTSELLTIAINSIAKPAKFNLCEMLLPIVRQNFQKAQKDFIHYTCKFVLQHKTNILITEEDLLVYCKKQYTGTITVPEGLEKLPFWKNSIFLCLAQIFLQKNQVSIPVSDDLTEIINLVQKHFPKKISLTCSFANKRDFLTNALAKLLISMHSECINPAESTPSTISMYESTTYERFLQSVDSLTEFIKTCFMLDVDKSFSLNNLRSFQQYTNELLLRVVDNETKHVIKGSSILCIAETQTLDRSKEIHTDLSKISGFIKKTFEKAMQIFVLYNQPYQSLASNQVVQLALSLIDVDVYFPDILFVSEESSALWKEIIQHPPAENLLSQPSQTRECISTMYVATVIELTQCLLKLCQKLFVDISNELISEPVTEQSAKAPKLQFIEIAQFLYPKILLEPLHNQCIFQDLVSLLAMDKFDTKFPQSITLAIKSFLSSQHIFVLSTYTHLTKCRLKLPLTGTDLLAFCKKQYGSTIPSPLSLATFPSWNRHIFYSLAHIFLLDHKKTAMRNFHLSDPEIVFQALERFFPESAPLPLNKKIDALTTRLAEHIMLYESRVTHDPMPQITPYLCTIYENFLQSVVTIKGFFKTFFTMETGKKCLSEHVPEFQSYIKKLLANEPDFITKGLQEFFIICSEETESLEQKDLSPICTDSILASSLLESLMELSLALILFRGTMHTDLTPEKTLSSALQIICSTTSLPSSFINSSSGANALEIAMHAYLSDTLCLRFFEQTQLLSQETKVNPLQTAINEHISGQPCPQMDEHINWLSSMFISTEKELSSLHEKLYLNLKEDVRAAISTKTFPETPSKPFITTVNTCQAAMVSDLSIPTADTTEAAWGQESKITTTPVPEEGEEPLATLWQDIEQILSSEDFTDLFETPEDFTGLLTQEEFQLEEEDSEEKLDS